MGTAGFENCRNGPGIGCPFLEKDGTPRLTSAACRLESGERARAASRCVSDDHDGCPTFLAAVLTRARSSHRQVSLGFSSK